MVLIFSLARTAFLSSYNNIVLIFNLIRKIFLSIYKKFVLIFSVIRIVFFFKKTFSIYRMVDSQYSKNNYKSPKISTGAIIKNPGML